MLFYTSHSDANQTAVLAVMLLCAFLCKVGKGQSLLTVVEASIKILLQHPHYTSICVKIVVFSFSGGVNQY